VLVDGRETKNASSSERASGGEATRDATCEEAGN
jgi:hypothetical protein